MSHASIPEKHPAGTRASDKARKAIADLSPGTTIACADAHHIARSSGVPPHELGIALDLADIRLVKCQLGLFGYTPRKRRVAPLDPVPGSLEDALESATAHGRINCRTCWDIARTLKLPRQTVSDACEALGLKVKNCQLGAF